MTKESTLQEDIAILNVHIANKELQNMHRYYGQDCISKIVIIGEVQEEISESWEIF